MVNISDHITYAEAVKSQAAIRAGIDNSPDAVQLEAMKKVASHIFEPVRRALNKPIRVSSFFRSKQLNAKIGGAKNSQHTMGEAIDMDTESDNKWIFNYVLNKLTFDQLIWEFGDDNNPDWVHVSYRTEFNRRNVLKSISENGATKYISFKIPKNGVPV